MLTAIVGRGRNVLIHEFLKKRKPSYPIVPSQVSLYIIQFVQPMSNQGMLLRRYHIYILSPLPHTQFPSGGGDVNL